MIRITEKEIQKYEIEHINEVRRMAPECTVLLKSDGTLPWRQKGEIALYGSGARKTIKGGTGSGDVNVRYFITVEEGLRNAGYKITSDQWLDNYDNIIINASKEFVDKNRNEAIAAGINPEFYMLGKALPEPEYTLPLDAKGEAAIYVVSRNSGEGADRESIEGDINLTSTEIRDILAANDKYENFVLVLNVGGMVNLEPVLKIKNILLLGQIGTPTGDVLADLLIGKSYPSGKLTMSWANIEDYPSTEGFGNPDDTIYREGIYVGYRFFDSMNLNPIYPFGYGLGYADFSITPNDFEIDGDMISLSVVVKNIGKVVGKEVVQVYYSAPEGKMEQPYQQLASFAKTKELEPNEEQEITVSFSVDTMASYDEEYATYILEQGDYLIRVGNHSRNTHICGILRLNQNITTQKLKNICPGWIFDEIKLEKRKFSYEKESKERSVAKVILLTPNQVTCQEKNYHDIPVELPQKDFCSWEEVKKHPEKLKNFVGNLTEEDLASLCVGSGAESTGELSSIIGNASEIVAGASGETTHRLSNQNVGALIMADGPAGIRISKKYKIIDGIAKACDDSPSVIMLDSEIKNEQNINVNEEKILQDENKFYQFCTAIPIGTCLAQSWNVQLCEKIGDLIGSEMEMFGINLWLAPAMNIQRSPLCGRNFEYYSEDPVISGMIAAAVTNGVQRHKGCGTTAKHFACNNQETNRYGSNSIVKERALREIYLKGFEICVRQSQPRSIMTSYNLINGKRTCNRTDLLTSVLRDEWGYEGIVVTDWFSTQRFLDDSKNKYAAGSSAGCVRAGNDITMPGSPWDRDDILDALRNTENNYPITKAHLQRCAMRILHCILFM
ncbi:glycoside hydrolase family 3 protein, partial [Enterococcus sp. 12E11_DIV0728]